MFNLKKKERRICSLDSLYTLFLYFLICGVNEDDIFFVSYRIPKHIRNKINHYLIPHIDYENYDNSTTLNKIKKRIINISKRIYGILKIRCVLYLKTRNYKVKAYGPGHLYYSFPIYEYEESYLLEDGLGNYVFEIKEPEYNNTLRSKILHFFGAYSGSGSHKNIKKVYLTQDNVPDIIKNKTEVIDIKNLWDMKTDDEKNKILEIYDIKEVINNLNDNLVLLLTQCISEDQYLTLDEEIELYRHLIEKQETNNVIIKIHPREKKDYAKYFPNIKIINKPFPLEIFKCLDIKIDKIVTVSSTAALNFVNYCEIEIYDKKTSSEQLNNYITIINKMIAQKKQNK